MTAMVRFVVAAKNPAADGPSPDIYMDKALPNSSIMNLHREPTASEFVDHEGQLYQVVAPALWMLGARPHVVIRLWPVVFDTSDISADLVPERCATKLEALPDLF